MPPITTTVTVTSTHISNAPRWIVESQALPLSPIDLALRDAFSSRGYQDIRADNDLGLQISQDTNHAVADELWPGLGLRDSYEAQGVSLPTAAKTALSTWLATPSGLTEFTIATGWPTAIGAALPISNMTPFTFNVFF